MEFKTLKPIFKQLFNCLVLSCASFSALANVVMTEGHIRAMPETVPNTAAYFTLENHTDKAIRLIGVSTTVAKDAQLHTIIEDQGMVKMRHVEGFDIPSHGTLTLTPSGDHVMLLGLKAPLVLEQQVELQLEFDGGEKMAITLPVSKAAENAAEQEHHHHH
ncbi:MULTISPECIES: copper chaperone PCu(A)C [Shewanella]|jgi:copper(I)-binding protein|uniref:copper chaperone PCu(A)C n=1 Tax=Shewanella TaxID=22 RepID=UPI00048B11D1|nr:MULTISPECIES: copper chaperone PCu(A)C [Shewanella]MBP8118942.1 copper chaperone PCu(A)C [Shewanella sp.]AVI66554.1 copper chaperone PCu(A)C [Shewanella sp. WE21]MBI1676562.1 copper chaperone PCu(A)C [Shewanella sp. DW31]MCU7963796.1 copper chaperone PCu(A)C [Shewanella sp. SW32]MCU7971622.1 copper chaperone PCu(A)C [Shewanella sp. SW29]